MLNTACHQLKGVGARTADLLAQRGITKIQDLLFHLPYRYQDRTRVTPIAHVQNGDFAVVEGDVIHSEIQHGRRRSWVCRIADGSGQIQLRFFHFSQGQKAQLALGCRVRCFGQARLNGQILNMVHPEYQRVDRDEPSTVLQHLTPIYPAIQGLSQGGIKKLIQQALTHLEQATLSELIPNIPCAQTYRDWSLNAAIAFLHAPPPDASMRQLEKGEHPAQQRLAFEELLAHQVSLRHMREQCRAYQAQALVVNESLLARFQQQLTFTLTGAQQRVIAEIQADLRQPQPMMRLILGDVGSGKTVVAAMAILQAVASGAQVALMAPTEILAAQHYANFQTWFAALNIQICLLKGKLSAPERRHANAVIASGDAQVVIGTHALFQKQVEFKHLVLVIIDEQHRFGVKQRLALLEKGQMAAHQVPHQLIMSATPIPRTLYMTAYADLDISIIDELPPGRIPITTVAVANSRRDEIIARIRKVCARGQQVYWLCTLIEESETLQCQAAEDCAEYLKQQLSGLAIGLMHGRLQTETKVTTMQSFKAGDIDLLVATTVIEVGVDVPNASLMIIENPERLGLAQLHQLRGRVGRGAAQSYCILLYQSPLSNIAKERLDVLRQTNDGFQVAEKDLELRGPGELLGTQQTGQVSFRVAHLLKHQHLLDAVKVSAEAVVKNHPEYVLQLKQRWLPLATQLMSST